MKNIIGNMKQRITLQEAIESDNGSGGQDVIWQDVTTVWAQVEPILSFYVSSRGRELVQNEKLQSRSSYRVKIRYFPGVTGAMRMSYDGRIFNIRGVVNLDEAGRFLEILAEEGVAT